MKVVKGALGSETVETVVLVGPNASVASVRMGDLVVNGDAKRNKGEPWDEEVGANLALGRALAGLGEILVSEARVRLGDA